MPKFGVDGSALTAASVPSMYTGPLAGVFGASGCVTSR